MHVNVLNQFCYSSNSRMQPKEGSCNDIRLRMPTETIDTSGIYQKALDDLVSVNSLFTVAVFIGLSYASPGQKSLENRSECNTDRKQAERLILYEVVSFAFFLLSSLVAKILKVHINISQNPDLKDWQLGKCVTGFMLSISGAASILGIVLLSLSLAIVIEIKVGKVACGSEYALLAISSLWGIVVFALIIYVPCMIQAIYICLRNDGKVSGINPTLYVQKDYSM